MAKRRNWRIPLIFLVLSFAFYQIFPTILYYSKPLKQPVASEQTKQIEEQIQARLTQLKTDSVSWMRSFCKLLSIDPISIDSSLPGKYSVRFAKTDDATRFRQFFPAAAAQFPFQGEQLSLGPTSDELKEVFIHRAVCEVPKDFSSLFETVEIGSPRYETLLNERKEQLILATKRAPLPLNLLRSQPLATRISSLMELSHSVQELEAIYQEAPQIAEKLAYPIRSADRTELLQLIGSAREELIRQIDQIPAESRPPLQEKERALSAAEQALKKGVLWTSSSSLSSSSPLVQDIRIDREKQEFVLSVDPVIQSGSKRLQSLLMEEIAHISHATGEELIPSDNGYRIPFHSKKSVSSLLLFQLDPIKASLSNQVLEQITKSWKPNHPDLQQALIVQEETFESLSAEQKALCLVISKTPHHAIAVHVKGIDSLLHSYEKNSESEMAKLFFDDLTRLAQLLSAEGYRPVRTFSNLTFERRAPSLPLLLATREDWKQIGKGSYAALELGTVEERIAEENRIDTAIHEELLQWEDDYRAAQVSLETGRRLTIPQPIRNPLLSNLSLSFKKLIRGDEKRVLKWGLDLSGGKSIQLELRDRNNQVVDHKDAIKQGINELFERVNRLGVSDVSIRQLGNHIVLDFPGSDLFSAADLVKASSMSFHIANEKFGPMNPEFAEATDRFLRGVWNEAISTRRTDPESIAAIAKQHLYESPLEDATRLLQEGLSLKDESKVVVWREDPGYGHPLMIVFQEPALEGANLSQIHPGYDSSKGNYLSFEVSGHAAQERLKNWTSQYSKEEISGTSLDFSGRGRGWRMAVILNGHVISAPTLESTLSTSGSISGSFSQREIQKFAIDLKAGSLTYTPKILSETSISPELGTAEREQGIRASLIALLLVIGAMILYYRFAGVIASIAVLCNLVILWAVLQNMNASLSLAGIAGIILTIGMAVDANVLVFERIKEELQKTGKIASAIHAGYDKAFSAILDSNLTTILAALVLLQFDSGPIRAFAVTMIIGIASSMFTALFMTRTYFTYWVTRSENKQLSMASWLQGSNFSFLKWARIAAISAALITFVGFGSIFWSKSSILSLDFTGGYALRLELDSSSDRAKTVENALLAAGATPHDFQVREIQHSSAVELFLGTSLEEPGKPFSNLTENRSRIEWVRDAIQKTGSSISQTMDELQNTWSTMSGQMSESMRNQALIGLSGALIAIFIYLIIRFETRYASAALLCLIHDLVVTIAVLGILKLCGIPIQIDLTVVAALMTIVGYSLNDTIIVFDRIRENLKHSSKQPFTAIVQTSLNETLSRTAMTSGTTLLVVLALLLFGGSSIFSFSLVMTIGIIVGTLSSWFIAAPLLRD